MPPESPAKQLAASMRPYSPEVQKTARAALTKIRARIPGATEMVYNTLVGCVPLRANAMMVLRDRVRKGLSLEDAAPPMRRPAPTGL
jgi:hypothetical protein